MLDIANTDFLIAVPSLSKAEFETYSSRLFDTWDNYIEQSLRVSDYSISLAIEDGSIKGQGKIAVAISALYFGIGNYGSFISGIQMIREQVAYVSDKLVKSAASSFDENTQTTYKNNGGVISHLNRLFHKVQSGDMTAEEAMSEAERIIGDEANSSPEFMRKLNKAFQETPKYPTQITMFDELGGAASGEGGKTKKRSPRTPKPDLPLNPFRVEIWRDSKRDKKHIKVSKL